MTRRLVSTRREVPAERAGDYLVRWGRLRAAVEARGGHAWLFRAARRESLFIEFIEWEQAPGEPALPEEVEVAAAREALDAALGAGETEEWREARPLSGGNRG